MAFYYGWNSWVVEILGGAVGMTVLCLIFPIIPAIVFGVLISLIYERFVDLNGWSWVDVGQRAVGMVIPVLIKALL